MSGISIIKDETTYGFSIIKLFLNNLRGFTMKIINASSALLAGGLLLWAVPNQASAKSYAKVKSNVTMTAAPTSRNVTTTGTNALYTKAGTLKGARKLATTYTMSTLGNSSNPQKFFRAYRVATTSRGSVYYKIVSFDQKYRGWIYGGKSTSTFGGGVQLVSTTVSDTLSSTEQNSTYYFKDPGQDSVTRNYPTWTQYKTHKVIDSSQPYANDELKVTQSTMNSRNNTKYFYITDDSHPEINGWIEATALTTTQPGNANVTPAPAPTPTPTTKNLQTFAVMSTKDVSLSGDDNVNYNKLARTIYAYSFPTADGYQYDANDRSAANQNAIKKALGDGQIADMFDTGIMGSFSFKVQVTFDNNGIAHVSLLPGKPLGFLRDNFVIDTTNQTIQSFYKATENQQIINGLSSTWWDDATIMNKLTSNTTADGAKTITITEDGVPVTYIVSFTITRAADGQVNYVKLTFNPMQSQN